MTPEEVDRGDVRRDARPHRQDRRHGDVADHLDTEATGKELGHRADFDVDRVRRGERVRDERGATCDDLGARAVTAGTRDIVGDVLGAAASAEPQGGHDHKRGPHGELNLLIGESHG